MCYHFSLIGKTQSLLPLQVRNSICHTATIVANAFMHSGTTSDTFLRDNLEWLSRATNWAKFTATASLGVIHKGHEKDALKFMATYLPKDSGNNGGFVEFPLLLTVTPSWLFGKKF